MFSVKVPRKTEAIVSASFDVLSAFLEQGNDVLFELNTWVVGSGAVFLLLLFRILLKYFVVKFPSWELCILDPSSICDDKIYFRQALK